MPTSFLSADAGFPQLTNNIPMEERMNRIQQYLYMLLEQLRYVLSNLGEENFNEAALKEIGEGISGPIMSVVTDLQGNVSTLEQTASSLTSRISNAEGDISTLTQTATSLTSRISNAEGDISSLEQTAQGLTTRVANAEGDISVVSQKADRIDWIVAGGGSASTFTLTSRMASLIADEISITGVVTFNDLQNPASQAFINGNNLLLKSDSTGNSGSYLALLNEYDHDYGLLWTLDTSYEARTDQFFDEVMYTVQADGAVDGKSCGLWLLSLASLVIQGSRVKIESNGDLYLAGSNGVYIEGNRYLSGKSGCYSFCADGIYYGNTRIVAT